MGSARTVEAKAPERSPAATLARAPVAAVAARPSSAAALQRRLGNSAVVALAGYAASLAISSPGSCGFWRQMVSRMPPKPIFSP